MSNPGCCRPSWSQSAGFRNPFRNPSVPSGPAPFAGLLELDFTTPVEQPFPASAAEMVALGLPSPTAIWTMEEAAPTVTDKVGSVDLTQNGAGVQPVFQEMASGFWDGSSCCNKKAVEFFHTQPSQIQAANAALLNPGAQSFSFLMVLRFAPTLGTNPYYASSWDAANVGWRLLGGNNRDRMSFQARDSGGTSNSLQIVTINWRYGWHCVLCVVDRNASTFAFYTTAGSIAPIALTIGDITSTIPLTIGNRGTGSNSSADCQVAYAAYWLGANAEGMNQTDLDAFFIHGTDPTGYITSIDTTATEMSDVVDDNPSTGLVLTDERKGAFVHGYSPLLSNANKRGLRTRSFNRNDVGPSDELRLWTAVNTTLFRRETALASCEISPRGAKEAGRIEATANNGYAYIGWSASAGQTGVIGVFLKRTSDMVANVSGRLVWWDTLNAVELAATAFTATEKWQLVTLYATPVAGSSQLRIEISTSGEAVAMFRAFGNDYPFPALTQNMLGPIDGRSGNYQVQFAAGQYVTSAAGEIEAVVLADHNSQVFDMDVWDALESGSGNNQKVQRVKTTNVAELQIANSVGGTFANSTPAYDWTVERVIRSQWDAVNPITPGVYSRIIVNGVVTDGAAAGWASAETINRLHVAGQASALGYFSGLIAYIRTYAEPQ